MGKTYKHRRQIGDQERIAHFSAADIRYVYFRGSIMKKWSGISVKGSECQDPDPLQDNLLF